MTQGGDTAMMQVKVLHTKVLPDGNVEAEIRFTGSAIVDGEKVVIKEDKTMTFNPGAPPPPGPHRSVFPDPRQGQKI